MNRYCCDLNRDMRLCITPDDVAHYPAKLSALHYGIKCIVSLHLQFDARFPAC